MKEFRCNKCNCYLGEMTQGKIKKDAIILCTECMDKYEAYKGMADIANIANMNKSTTPDMPDFFKEMFK